jgi:uncharacterized protein YifN (PemK superfamily)
MAIPFQPKPRSIVYCDFRGYEAPEMIKRRPVIVLANHKTNSRLVTVVPLSTTRPESIEAHHYCLRQNPLPNLGITEVWAKCDMIAVVSTSRLDLVRTGRRQPDGKREYLQIRIGQEQFDEIRRAVAHALGLAFVLDTGEPVHGAST